MNQKIIFDYLKTMSVDVLKQHKILYAQALMSIELWLQCCT